MASKQDLEALRVLALDEQYSAAVEQRVPNRDLLDSLGKLVLPDFALVMCEADFAYKQDLDDTHGYCITKIDEPISVFGKFGGFFSRAIEVEHQNEIVEAEKVLYYVMTDNYRKDTGYLFPVESSDISDVFITFKDDPIFEELTHELGQEKIDIQKIASIVDTKVYGSQEPLYHAVYIQQMITPSELFNWVQVKAGVPIGFGEDFSDQMENYNLGMDITQDHSFGLMQIDQKDVRLTIMQSSVPSIVMPVSYINGYVGTDMLNDEHLL